MAGLHNKLIWNIAMPRHPLFNDTTISLSATLAATIGLNEAILLTILNDAACLQSQPWARFNSQVLREQLPFWEDATIRTVLQSLINNGLVQVQGSLFPETDTLFFNFGSNQTATATPARQSIPRQQQPPQPAIQQAWQPSADTLLRLQQHGIENSFALAHLDAFILQISEHRNNRGDLNARFFRYVKSQWVYAQNRANQQRERTSFQPVNREAAPMVANWRPSRDAVDILVRDQIDPQFVQDAIAEFILYWSERGQAHNTWSSKFVQHVRLQWHRFIAAEEHGGKPMPITENWQPSADCFDIIEMAHIERQFAEQLVPEFVMYWRESKQIHNSWNSRFLQYVKQRWGARLTQTGGQHGQATAKQHYATAEASIQRLNDTSWAN